MTLACRDGWPTLVPMFLRLACLILATASLIAVEGGTLEKDLWYVGTIAGQPAVSMHAVTRRHPDGSRSSQVDTRIVLKRVLAGTTTAFSVLESQTLDEDASGKVTSFRLEQDQNGSLTTAAGKVVGREVHATVHRLGRATDQRIPLPEGIDLLGQQAGQDLLVRHPPAVGGTMKSASLVLMGQIQVLTTTATLLEKQPDGFRYRLATDIAPPATALIDAAGDMVSMEMDALVFKIVLTRSDGPVALLGAELAPADLVKCAGKPPRPQAENRYRLPPAALAGLTADPFQRVADGLLVVTSTAPPTALADPAPFLAAEPQLELDDPELRAWVEAIVKRPHADTAELAEDLRLRVRARIVAKDLSKGDGSALEAFRERRGDCTEHANLLCAGLRLAGIPARSEVGVVYVPDIGGWVGHAWNSAWWNGGWHHLDSAYPGIARSMYLKLGTTSGSDHLGTMAAMTKAFTHLAGATVETVP